MERTKRSYRQHVCRGGTEDFMRRGRHVVLLLLMVAIAGVSGFHPCSQGQGSFRTRTSSAGLSKKMSRKSACRLSRRLELGAKSSSTDEDDDPQSRGAYNDDCFGLIFLSGLILFSRVHSWLCRHQQPSRPAWASFPEAAGKFRQP
jgi:hypothetical protein